MMASMSDRLRIGGHEVDVARRTVGPVGGDGEAGRLTIKAVQVLLVLAEAGGKVVKRETLFARVWPDTMPTDDVLTQAVTQLRKAFGDDRDAPRYIETIAKGGYRLVADVEWACPGDAGDTGDGTMAGDAVEAARGGVASAVRGRLRWAGLAGVAVALAVLVWAAMPSSTPPVVPVPATQPRPEPVPVEYRAITSMPGQERWPSLSPDGSMVAFSQVRPDGQGGAILLQASAHASARPLTSPPADASDHMPVWARDGRRIAFIRRMQRACHVMVVAVNGGIERTAGDCLQRSYSLFDWTPDGRALVMGGLQDPAGTSVPLRLLDLSTGEWRALQYEIPPEAVDLFPRYSPDGKWLAFRRNESLSDLWMMPAEGGTPRRLTTVRGDIRGWDWLPDSSGVVYSHVTPSGSLFVHTLADGSIRPLPALGAGHATFPDVAHGDWSMVFEISESRGGIFRFPIGAGEDAHAEGEHVFESTASDMLPSVSPDGGLLAFFSDRAMSLQLWIGETGHRHKLHAVEGVAPVPRHRPVWSADGRRLLVVGSTDDGDRLFEVEVNSGTVRRLPVPDATPVHAAYTGDPGRLLVGVDEGGGRLRLMLYQLPDWQVVASVDDVAIARYDERNDMVFFTRPSRRGLWRADAGLRSVEQVSDAFPAPWLYRNWEMVAGEAYYAGPAEHCQTVWRRIDEDGEGRCVAKEVGVIAGSPSVDGSGRWLYVALPTRRNTDVGWASLRALAADPPSGEPDAGH